MKVEIIRTLPKGEKLVLLKKTKPVKEGGFDQQIFLNPEIKYQTHLGFGGAITEAVSYSLIHDMPEGVMEKVIKLYFSPVGLNYSLTRIHMNSSDFSLQNYTYVEENDLTLASFDISREDQYTIPTLKQALKENPALKIMVSPWSPPKYMKTNNDMNHGGSLKPEFAALWASYYVKFIDELHKRNVPVWAISVQNEPAAKQVWDSCLYSPEEERDFVKFHLGPTLKNSAYSQTKIFIWDHNRDILLERALPIYKDEEASQYVYGTAFHWYVSLESENLTKLHNLYPDKHLLFTEGCIEGGPRPLDYASGMRYARNIINDFNHFNEGFIDWNIALNEVGGPNHVGNYCDAPILLDRINKTLILNYSFYAIAHFSKFIEVGAKRIYHAANEIEGARFVSYQNPGQEIVIVYQNETDENLKVKFNFGDNQTFSDIIPPLSLSTYIIEEKK